jgi:rod shape-determining protein MreD
VRSAFATFLTLLLLWAVLAQLNHSLAPWHITLFAAGLYVTQAALFLRLRPGLAAVFAAGLVCDANSPVGFGTHALLFACAYSVIHRLGDRLPHDEMLGRIAIALIVNFALFFLLTFLELRPVPAAAWPRLAADLLISQVFLGLIAPWFFALQRQALVLAAAVPAPAFRA